MMLKLRLRWDDNDDDYAPCYALRRIHFWRGCSFFDTKICAVVLSPVCSIVGRSFFCRLVVFLNSLVKSKRRPQPRPFWAFFVFSLFAAHSRARVSDVAVDVDALSPFGYEVFSFFYICKSEFFSYWWMMNEWNPCYSESNRIESKSRAQTFPNQ